MNDSSQTPPTPHDNRPSGDVEAWIDGQSPADQAELRRVWQLASLARGRAPTPEDATAAHRRLEDTIDGRRTRDPALRPPSTTRRRMVAVLGTLAVLVAAVFVLWWRVGAPPVDDRPEFIILLRGGDDPARTPVEQQAVVDAFTAWAGDLARDGRLRAGDELAPDGRVLFASGERLTDRPYTSPDDGIGGFFIIAARDYQDAVDVARTCPQLSLGGAVEVRRIIRR